ncbi:MAG: M16 family metallopeptidase [Oscillospiraceae bacterium]
MSDNLSCNFDSRAMSFSISCIDDRYTLNGEKLEEECCRLLLDCLLDPKTDGDGFDPAAVDIMRQELIDAIESVKGDKRSYAAQQGAAAAYPGEPCGLPVNGTVEQARAVTPQSAYSAWKSMLETGRIEIFCAGCSDFAASERVLRERLCGLARGGIHEVTPSISVLKPDVFRVTETMPMQQAIMRMYFKAPALTDRYAGALLSLILGGMATSRFFTNIREKQSLCYYCSSFSNRFKKTLTVYAGVDAANLQKTERAVMTEFMNVCMKGVTDEELEHAKLELCESARAVYDSAGAISSWYSSQIADPVMLTPEQFAEGVQSTTAKQVTDAARLYSLDTVYTLTPEEVR